MSEAEDIQRVSKAFEDVAIPFATTPILCNRFQFFQMGGTTPVLVFGGIALAMPNEGGEPRIFPRPLVAITFNKEFAADLATLLQSNFGLTDDDMAAARGRVIVAPNENN